MQVARDGEAAEPTEPAPAPLRRYLRFARLPAPALDIARRVVEEDDAFRERVAGQLTEDDVGEAGWIWLTRPEGWEARLEELRKHQQEQEHALHEERAEREAHRRLSGAEDRARRAEVALTARTSEVVGAREDLARERALRLHAETEHARIVGSIDELTAQRTAAEHLSGALAAASQLLAAPVAPSVAATPAASSAPTANAPKHMAAANRMPLRLPPGITDDSVEAVEHLVRAPGALLLVDGYNI